MKIEFRIDRWHPTRLNQLLGCHYMKARRFKKLDRDLIAATALQFSIPKAKGKRRVRLVIVLGPRQRAADPDAYWKSLLDALVRAGLLVDDNRQNVELLPVEFYRSFQPSTVIELEDIE